MTVDDPITEQSVAAVAAFRARIERYGIWDHVWMGVVSIRKAEDWILTLFRVHFAAPAVRIPPPTKMFDASTSDVVIRVRDVSIPDAWRVLEGLARGDTAALSEVTGVTTRLPSPKSPTSWSSSESTYSREGRVHVQLSHSPSASFHQLFGYSLFDKIGPQLRQHEPPYSSLKEVASALMFWGGGGWETNNANPIFEASAEFPIQLSACFYNRARQGIELQLEIGKKIDVDRLSASLTPQPRLRVPGREFESRISGEVKTLSTIVHCEEPDADVEVHVQYDDVQIASAGVRAQERGSFRFGNVEEKPAVEEWEATLGREFHWTRRMLRGRLGTVLPPRLAAVAEWRLRESILLRETHPFFAVLSAASVAEVLLHERLAKVTRTVRASRWAEMRAEDQRLPRKMPAAEQLTFNNAILFAQRLGLLEHVDLRSIGLLREARNEIHLDRRSRLPGDDFSPVRASHAILATLDVCR